MVVRMSVALAAVVATTSVSAQTSSSGSHLVGAVPRDTYQPFRNGLFNSLPYADGAGREERGLRAYADCVVRRDPVGTREYLRQSMGAMEPTRFMELRAATRSCFIDTYGADLLATKSLRTAAIADAARRRVARSGHL